MNEVLLRAYLARNPNRDINIEDIILGDVAQRDKYREKQSSDNFEKYLEKIIGENKYGQ